MNLLLTVDDYEAAARLCLTPDAYDYYRSGADDETSLRRNRSVWDRVLLRPRVLVDVSDCDLATTVLGTPIAMPILVAPTAYHGLAHAEGEVATARGAGEAGSLMTVSTMSNRTLEEVAAAARGPLWFQLYVFRDRHVSEGLVRRAEKSGYQALMLTADVPVLGQRLADRRNGFGLPPPLRAANFPAGLSEEPPGEMGVSSLATYAHNNFDRSLTWDALRWLKSLTSLPVVVKGLLTAEDATEAVRYGAAAIVVSNHGGRQLDGAITAVEALPEILEAVDGRCEVYLDGGIRRGTDVLKALALGVRAIFVGRAVLWGLAVDGSDGVRQVLHVLRDELERAMQLCGRPSLKSLDASVVRVMNSTT